MNNTISIILLVAFVIALSFILYSYISTVLAGIFSSSSTEMDLYQPPDIEKVVFEDYNTCFFLRNPNKEQIEVNNIIIYINGKKYTVTSDTTVIQREGVVKACVNYVPTGGEEAKISIPGATASTKIQENIVPDVLEYSCGSCSKCN